MKSKSAAKSGKAQSPYRLGSYYLIQRSGIWYIYGTTEERRFRFSTKCADLPSAKKVLENFFHETESGWRNAGADDDWKTVADAVWKRHKHGAMKRGIPFTISPRDVYSAMRSAGFICAVSGIPFVRSARPNAAMPDPWGPSIDRIATAQGYVPGNIRVVCLVANLAMNRYGYDTLLRLANGVMRSAVPVREPDEKQTQWLTI
jgi:hypothetical protein